jgi:multicomponent Na+:H+ antiporter subunit E
VKAPFWQFCGTGGTQPLRAAMARGVGFVLLWLVLAGGGPIDLIPGAVAALAVTCVSFYLLPPSAVRVRHVALARFVLHFLRVSVVAGVDVARRALDPRLPLHPGFAVYPAGLPPCPMRNMFTTLMSLLPGTVPTGPANGGLLIHCLDIEQPITAQLAAEEALFSNVVGRGHDDG